MSAYRYTRQVRLAEVGEAGQARLLGARVGLRTTGVARSIERTYLSLAGVTVDDDAPTLGGSDGWASAVEGLAVEDPAVREVATGALAALVAMRAALGVGEVVR